MQCIFKLPSTYNINSVHEICDRNCHFLTAGDVLEMENIDISYRQLASLFLPVWHKIQKNHITAIFEQRTPLSCASHPLSVHFLPVALNLPINSTPRRRQYILPNDSPGLILYLNCLFIVLKFYKRSLASFCFNFPVASPFTLCIWQPCYRPELTATMMCPCSPRLWLSTVKLYVFFSTKGIGGV